MPEPVVRPPTPSADPRRTSWVPWVLVAIFLAVLWGWQLFGTNDQKLSLINYTSFYSLVQDGKVATVTMTGPTVAGRLKEAETVDGRKLQDFRTTLPSQEDRDLLPLLREKQVEVKVKSEEQPVIVQLLVGALPWILLIGAWFWLSRRAQRFMPPGGGLGNIMKGRAKRFEVKENVRVRFDDVAGLKAAKRDLREIVDFLREPERFRRLGGKVPRGVLLVGPPGTGKTLVARAVAGESGVPFFSINGSEFIELFVGVGASRVRELFDEAKKSAPAIVFIDEIDAVGRVRGTGLGGGNDEREQTLNQLLSEMDGFTRNDLTVVLAATNRPDVLDPALLRPGRFDRRIVIDRPECPARLSILEVHTKGKPLGHRCVLARAGREHAGLFRRRSRQPGERGRAQCHPARRRRHRSQGLLRRVGQDRARRSRAKRRSRPTRSSASPFTNPATRSSPTSRRTPSRCSASPSCRAAWRSGVTQQTAPARPAHGHPARARGQAARPLGGYAAEPILFGNISSGSENDLQQATELAYKMVAHYGMSPEVGPVYHEHHTEHPFLGQRLATDGGISETTVYTIEQEARRILSAAVEDAKAKIREHRDALDRLVAALLKDETIEKKILLDLVGAPLGAHDHGWRRSRSE